MEAVLHGGEQQCQQQEQDKARRGDRRREQTQAGCSHMLQTQGNGLRALRQRCAAMAAEAGVSGILGAALRAGHDAFSFPSGGAMRTARSDSPGYQPSGMARAASSSVWQAM